VSTMVFITHCWKNVRQRLERSAWGLAALLMFAATAAWASTVDLADMRTERADGALVLHTTLKLELGPAVEEALVKGVPVYFVAEAEVLRDRWYWYDRKIASVTRYYRIVYQPLTRQWRLNVSGEPLSASGLGGSISQSFDNLADALSMVRRQSGWKLADLSELDPDARHNLNYRFRLDVAQLPRPFQIAAGSQADWSLSLNRNLRINPEPGR
jgi:Domain of unknown function (DUF4390)